MNKRLFVAMAVILMMVPALAFAQTGPTPLPMPTLTPTVGIVTTLSLLAGVLTNWIQTGTLLGRWITPKTWLPDLTMGSTALGGFLGYVTSQSPVSLSGTNLFYGAIAAVAALVAGAAPGAAIHVHATLTAQRREAIKAAAAAVAKAATALVLIFSLATTSVGCGQPLLPLLDKVGNVVLKDLQAGVGDVQLASDVCQALGGTAQTDQACANVAVIINDTITALIDMGLLTGVAAERGKSYKMAHAPAAPASK